MELRVNDYVRTKDGRIGKIIQEEYITPYNDKHRYIYLTDADDEMWYDEETIIKSSPNIIDLIEVGDYVNGHRVLDIAQAPEKALYLNDISQKCALIPVCDYQIKSIVTKEMYSSVEYRVGE